MRVHGHLCRPDGSIKLIAELSVMCVLKHLHFAVVQLGIHFLHRPFDGFMKIQGMCVEAFAFCNGATRNLLSSWTFGRVYGGPGYSPTKLGY